MISTALFPRLTAQNHRVTSPSSTDYNCIAWVVGAVKNWWQPGLHWPWPAHRLDESLEELKRLFQSLGFDECPGDKLETGYEKIVLYEDTHGYTHAAKQLPTGKWSSRLGNAEDIEHDTPGDVASGIYGRIAVCMRRGEAPIS